MADSTQPAGIPDTSMQDRDEAPASDWLAQAVAARTLAELRGVASAARAAGALTPRDQAWCRALAAHLSDVDAAAMRVVAAELGAVQQ